MSSLAVSTAEALRGKRIVVTGGPGFVGSHLVRRLVDLGCQVTLLARLGSNRCRIQDVAHAVTILPWDLNNRHMSPLQERLAGTQIMFHLAAAGVRFNEEETTSVVETNVLGTLSLLQLANRLQIERFVYCGSCSEYGPGESLSEDSMLTPICEYGASKASGSMLANAFHRKHGLPSVCLRPFLVYGPFEAKHRLIPHTILQALNDAPIPLTVGTQTRDFVFVQDVVEALLEAAIMPKAIGETFNICTGVSTSVRRAVDLILELMNSKSRPLFGTLPLRRAELWLSSGSAKKVEEVLGWRARTALQDGLLLTINWFREHRLEYMRDEQGQLLSKI